MFAHLLIHSQSSLSFCGLPCAVSPAQSSQTYSLGEGCTPQKTLIRLWVGEKGGLSETQHCLQFAGSSAFLCSGPMCLDGDGDSSPQSACLHGGSLDHPGCPESEASSVALVLLLGMGKSASGTCQLSGTFPSTC